MTNNTVSVLVDLPVTYKHRKNCNIRHNSSCNCIITHMDLIEMHILKVKYERDTARAVLENVEKEAHRISSPDERLRIIRLMEGK